MKRIVVSLLIVLFAVGVADAGWTPLPKHKKVAGSYVLNKTADSVGWEFGGDTAWITPVGFILAAARAYYTDGTGQISAQFKSSNATDIRVNILNTGAGNAFLFFDAVNGDIAGSDYGQIGQYDDSSMGYDIGASATYAWHEFTVGNAQKLKITNTGVTFGGSAPSTDFTFPLTDGTANQVLRTAGNGTVSWQDQAGAGGGDDNKADTAGDGTNVVAMASPTIFQQGDNVNMSVINGDTINFAVDTADAVANAEVLVVTGNAVYDYGVSNYLLLAGGTMSGGIDMNDNVIDNATKIIVQGDGAGTFGLYLNNDGGGRSGSIYSHNNGLTTGMYIQFDSLLNEIIFSDTVFAARSMRVGNGATTAGFVDFREDTDNGTNAVKLIGPASTADITLTLPPTVGANGEQLTSDGAGVMSWAAAGGAGALTYFTEADDNDTSVFTATGPNTTVGFNNQLTMQDNDISGVEKLTADTAVLTQINISADEITDLAGPGIKVVSGVLSADTADAVANAETLPVSGNAVYDYLVASNIPMDTIAAPTFFTIQQMQNVFHSVGWTSGGAFTDSTDGAGDIDSLHIAAGTGLIRTSDIAADTNTIFFFDWGDTIIEIPADTTLFIGVKYNAGTPVVFQTTADKTLLDHQQNFELGTVTNETGLLHITFNPHAIGDHATLMIERTQGTMGIQRDNDLGGLILGEKETRHLTVTAGTLFSKLNSFSISAIDLFVSGSMDRYYRAAGSGFTKQAAVTQWNNTQWDDGDGGLATLANNKYGVQWFYIELDGNLISMYGRATHNSLSLAEGESPPATLPLRLTVNQAKLIGRVLFQESSATASEIQTVFTTSFPATAAEDHGNLAGLSDDDHTQYLLRSQFPDSVVKIIEDSIATMSLDSVFVGVSPPKAAVFGATTTKPGYIMQEPDAHFGDADDGMIEIGNAMIALGARDTLYNADSLDIGGTMVFRQTVEPDGLFEFAFYENGGDLRFVIPKSGDSLGTWCPRSMLIAGPARMIDSVVRFDFWGFTKIDANTDATGADIGVQDDLEVMGKIYGDTIDNITAAPIEILADLAMNSNDITGADSVDITKYTDGSIDLPDLATSSVDSTKVADGDLSIDDVNWTYEYIELNVVHGWDPSDTTILSLPRFEGNTPLLFRDSTVEASKKDTAYVSGTVPFDCSVDSIIFSYKVTGASVLIDSLELRGPDRSAFTNLADSSYFSSGTNRTSTSIARVVIDVTDFTATAGDRYALKFSNDLAADNGTVKVYYVQLAVRR